MRILTKSIALSVLLAACGHPKSSSLMQPPQKISEVTFSASGLQVQHEGTVDILFVLDNSYSMKDELDDLKRNISEFAKSFAESSIIDFHIGAVKVHDTSRYNNSTVLKVNPLTKEKNYLEKGELTPIGDKRFIDRDNFDDLENLFVMETPYVSKNQWADSKGRMVNAPENKDSEMKAVAVGPEIEESFSPVLAALSDRGLLRSSNRGFHRGNSHLVVIFVTDAEDSSPNLNPEELFQYLFDLKDHDLSRLSAYGVLCRNGDLDCQTRKSTGGAIESDSLRIQEFIKRVSNAKNQAIASGRIPVGPTRINPILNIKSSSWGKELAKIGREIKETTLEKRIPLGNAVPEYDPKTHELLMTVTYGGTELDCRDRVLCSYDRPSNTVTIHAAAAEIETANGDNTVGIKLTKVK